MAKFIHKFLVLFFSFASLNAQVSETLLLDTLIQADEVYMDPIGHIYLVNHLDKRISKFDIHLNLLKKISFKRGWNQASMDVSDPFKCILYYPGDYKILILDESLSIIGSYEETDLNLESAVCQFSSDLIGLFTNNVLKLKNYQKQQITYSVPFLEERKQEGRIQTQLKHSNSFFYLFRSGTGVVRFNNQLFEDKRWLNSKIQKIDVVGDDLFCQESHQIFKIETKFQFEKLMVSSFSKIRSFAVNWEYLVWLEENRLKMIRWKSN